MRSYGATKPATRCMAPLRLLADAPSLFAADKPITDALRWRARRCAAQTSVTIHWGSDSVAMMRALKLALLRFAQRAGFNSLALASRWRRRLLILC